MAEGLDHRSLGQIRFGGCRPRNRIAKAFWLKAIFNIKALDKAVGQKLKGVMCTCGDAAGYDGYGRWPSPRSLIFGRPFDCTIGGMKRAFKLATAISVLMCFLALILLPLSIILRLPEPTEEGIDPGDSIPIGGNLRLVVSQGYLWFYSGDFPYQGSTIGLEDPSNKKILDGHWYFGRNGMAQETVLSQDNRFLTRSRYGDFPGIYYRRFEWWDVDYPWTTLAISLFYPMAFFAILPTSWLIRRFFARRTLRCAKPLPQTGVH